MLFIFELVVTDTGRSLRGIQLAMGSLSCPTSSPTDALGLVAKGTRVAANNRFPLLATFVVFWWLWNRARWIHVLPTFAKHLTLGLLVGACCWSEDVYCHAT
eukprot:m.20153 g.20153  ORF g.20153 m.20153 type:complete len:102 (+) comp11005_c0_seq6:456-761(+)